MRFRGLIVPILFAPLAACGKGEDGTATPSAGGGSGSASAADMVGSSNFDGPPVIVVGMDGLEWDVLKPLLDAGRVPHFAELIDRGFGGSIQTFQPTFSPVVWTTIATGVGPQQHGVLNFSEVEGNQLKEDGLPYTSNSRAVPAIWNIASEAGRNVLCVGWWVSWPAEEVNGRIVASYAAQAQGRLFWKAGVWEDGLPELTYPEDLIWDVSPILERGGPGGPVRQEYEERFGIVPPPPDGAAGPGMRDPWQFPRERDAFFRTGFHADRTHLEIFKQQLEVAVADLNMVYFGLADVAGHFWWRYFEPDRFQYSIPPEQIALLRERIDQAYLAMDDFLGEIMEVAPDDARIVVLSDHGMHAGNLNAPHLPQSGVHEDAPPGVFLGAGPDIKPGGLAPTVELRLPVQVPGPNGQPQVVPRVFEAPRLAMHVGQVTPTLLDWLRIPYGADMIGPPIRVFMEKSWADAHPVESIQSHAGGYREPTPPREPRAGASDEFMKDFMTELGYLESVDRAGGR